MKETYEDGSKYEGDKINNQRNGRGKYIFDNGDIYDGQFGDDKCNGIGFYYVKGEKLLY